MAKRTFFRNNDKVSVHGWMLADGPVSGRVVCTNRLSKYGEVVVVLASVGGSEHVLTFKEDGRRYLPESSCYVTLGSEP